MSASSRVVVVMLIALIWPLATSPESDTVEAVREGLSSVESPSAPECTPTPSEARVDSETETGHADMARFDEESEESARDAQSDDTSLPPQAPNGDESLKVTESHASPGVGVASAAGTSAQAQTDAQRISSGHIDVAARVRGSQLEIAIKDGSGTGDPVYRDPRSVVIEVPQQASVTIPADPAFSFLGDPGSVSFILPQTEQAGIVWPGWNTEALVNTIATGPVTWQLRQVSGPGNFALFLNGAFGQPTTLFNSADGLPDSFQVPLGTHAHGNWAFSKPGTYTLAMDMTAPSATGVLRASTDVKFAVGDSAPLPAPTPTSTVTPLPTNPSVSPIPQGAAATPQAPSVAAPNQPRQPGTLARTGNDFPIVPIFFGAVLLAALGFTLRQLGKSNSGSKR